MKDLSTTPGLTPVYEGVTDYALPGWLSDADRQLIEGTNILDRDDAGFRQWKRGEAIDKPLIDGTMPSWDTVRDRYWKNRYETSKMGKVAYREAIFPRI